MRLLPFILLFWVLRASAAQGAIQPGVLVHVWQSQDGLPGNVVRSVAQASDGYLWVATAEGVARFDGYEFEVIEPEGELRRYRFAFSRLFTTSGGDVWAATYQGGLFRVHQGRLRQILDNLRRRRPPMVTQLVEGEHGVFFFKRGAEFGQISSGDEVAVAAPTADMVRRFEADFTKQQAGGRVVEPGTSPALRDSSGGVWSATDAGGVSFTMAGEAVVPIALPRSGQAYPVNELLEDREGDVWIASPGNGLVRVRHARVDVLDPNDGQNERAVSALLEDHAGTWWIANGRGGLNQWSPSESRFVPLSTARYPRPAAALFEDQSSRLWVASRDGSVFRFDDGVFKPQFVKTQVPSKVRSISQDSRGTLWFGGTHGLASLAGETVRQFGKADGVGDLDLTVVRQFPGGRIIAGSSEGTVLLGGGHGFAVIGAPQILKYRWISSILPVAASETWVTTLGSGLYLWDGQQWFCFDQNAGLPDARLTVVLDDGRGDLWLGSLGGIIRVNRQELLAHARNPELAVQWLRLDHTDGMPSRECIGGFQPAGWRAKDGILWFPTGGGIARVRPELVKMNQVAPAVYLQNVRVNGVQQTGDAGPITTEPGRARIEFRFVGISLSAPEKVTYRARLAGLDDSWRELGNQRVAAYEAVPPGKYTFEVLAVNGDGLCSAAPARISLVVAPRFWETAWFYFSVGVLILSIAAGIGWMAARRRLKSRIQALRIRNARDSERSRIARDLHDDLGASLTEISILAALAAEDAEHTPLSQPLDQISVKAKYVVGSLDEIVWAVNPREDTLRSLVDYLAAYAREFLDIARIALRLDVTLDIPEVALATSRRHGVFLTVREALNNIVKHAGASEVMLRIAVTDELLEIRLEDNGRGFEPDYAGSGNGLGNLQQRMREAGGDCRIETHRGQGTTVFLTLPLLPGLKPVS